MTIQCLMTEQDYVCQSSDSRVKQITYKIHSGEKFYGYKDKKGTQTKLKGPFWLQIESHSPIINIEHPWSHSWLPAVHKELMIALLIREDAKISKFPNNSIGPLKSSFSFLYRDLFWSPHIFSSSINTLG